MAREMKDSGIEWIGEIPKNYSVYRLKYLLKRTLDYGANSSGVEYSNYLPRYIRITDITTDGKLKDDGALSLELEDASPYMLEDGDILFARSGATVGKSFIYHTEYGRAAFAGYLIRAQLKEKIVPEYIYYYTCSRGYEIWKSGIFIQSTIQNISADKYANLPIVLPDTKDEQMRIVGFLRHTCDELDNLLDKTRASIEEYKKLKQAVITQAVTKGIRGGREMKDSGIEWIGEIPEEWPVKKLRYLGRCQNGISKSSEYFGEGYPFVSYGDVYRNFQLPEMVTGLIMSTDSDRENYSVIRGDVLFTRTSETIEEVGFSSVCLKTIKYATFAGFVIRFRPHGNGLLPEYSKYYFRSDIHRRFFVKEMNLVTRASLGQELLKKLPVILPPLKEQEEIANYLDQKCSAIDELIAKKEQYLSEIENYRKSLIYEYVTGKKEVPCKSVD